MVLAAMGWHHSELCWFLSMHLSICLGEHPGEGIQSQEPQQRRSVVLGDLETPRSCCHSLLFLAINTQWLACAFLGVRNISRLHGLAQRPMLRGNQEEKLRDSLVETQCQGPPVPTCTLSPVFSCLPLPVFVTGWQQESDTEPIVCSTTAVDRAGLDALPLLGAGVDIPAMTLTKLRV